MSSQFLLSNMLSSILVSKFNLDPMYAMILSSTIGSNISDLNYETIVSYLTFNIVISLITTLLMGMSTYYLYNKKTYNQINTIGYNFLTLYDYDRIHQIMKYVEKKPTFFDTQDVEYGNSFFPETQYVFFPVVGSRINFNDTDHQVKGYLSIGITKEEDTDKPKKQRYIRIYTENTCMIPLDYFKKIEKYHEDEESKKNLTEVYYMKYTSSKSSDIYRSKVKIYSGVKNNHEDRYKQYMLSYFSPKRQEIWDRVSRVQFHPELYHKMGQAATCNMLFYGPPGTGKSTLAYRIAVTTGRHLLSLNFLDFIEKKTTLYNVLMSPYIVDRHIKPSECIFLLEEFDKTVRYLEENDTKYDFTKLYGIGGKFHPHSHMENEDSGKEEKKKDEDKDNSKMKIGKSNELHLGDLLEILQGSVPIEGSMIIATTNHYEYIKKTLPALVRPGRLTPVHVNYLDWASLQELCRYYFDGKELMMDEISIHYPTSGIIDMAISCQQRKNSFQEFEHEIKKLITIS